MSARTLLIVAVVIGLISSIFAARYIGGVSDVAKSEAALVPIVVANGNISAGAVIADSNLSTSKWPKSSIPEGAFDDPKKLVGRVVKQDLVASQPIFEPMLAPPESKGGLVAMIPVGKRAITVRVNEVMAVAGFALPGSYVDILASIHDPKGEAYTKTVLRHVKVLAVAQETEADPSKPKVVNAVTLELTEKESELLDLARSVGTLSLSLRNQFDDKIDASTGTRYGELFGQLSAEPKVETKANNEPENKQKGNNVVKIQQNGSEKTSKKVEVIRGLEKSLDTVQR